MEAKRPTLRPQAAARFTYKGTQCRIDFSVVPIQVPGKCCYCNNEAPIHMVEIIKLKVLTSLKDPRDSVLNFRSHFLQFAGSGNALCGEHFDYNWEIIVWRLIGLDSGVQILICKS